MCYIQLRISGPGTLAGMRALAEVEFSRSGIARSALRNGPVAQLGARFHGMEEVDGSNPSRSTKHFRTNQLAFVNGNLK